MRSINLALLLFVTVCTASVSADADTAPINVERQDLGQYWEYIAGSGGPPPASVLGPLLVQGIHGHVRLRIRIARDGTVDEVELLEIEPPDLDPQPFIESARSYRYEPVPSNSDRQPVITTSESRFGREAGQ